MLSKDVLAAFTDELAELFREWRAVEAPDDPDKAKAGEAARAKLLAQAPDALIEAAGPAPNTAWRWREGMDVEAAIRAVFEAGELGAEWDRAAAALAGNLIETGEPAPGELNEDWTAPPAPRRWLVPGWLPAGRIALLTGEGAVGKSRLAIQLCAAVATGDPTWLPGGPELAPDDPAVAVLVTWEDEKDEIARRLRAARGGDAAPAAVGNRFVRVGLAGAGPLWEPDRTGSGHIATVAGLSETGRWLRMYCARRRAKLLVLDPAAACYGSDENSRAHVRAFLASWDQWGRETGCAVLIVSHPPKTEGVKFSGSTDWRAAVRSMLTLEFAETGTGDEDDKGKRKPAPAPRLSVDKMSYALPPDPLWLEATGGGPWRVSQSAGAAARNFETGRDMSGGGSGARPRAGSVDAGAGAGAGAGKTKTAGRKGRGAGRGRAGAGAVPEVPYDV